MWPSCNACVSETVQIHGREPWMRSFGECAGLSTVVSGRPWPVSRPPEKAGAVSASVFRTRGGYGAGPV